MGKRRRVVPAVSAPVVVNINDVLEGHVALDVECIDGLYLNAYVPNLQVGGQVVRFLTDHLGNPVPSPALFEKIGNRFRRNVKDYAARDVATQPGAVCYAFNKGERRMGTYYSYIRARASAPASSRSAPASRTRPRCGATAMSGPGARQFARASSPRPWPTGSSAVPIPMPCGPSATASNRRTCRASSTVGSRGSPRRSLPLTTTPATGGSCPCAKSRSAAPWSSTTPAGLAASSSPWWPTTSGSAVPSRCRWSSAVGCRPTPRASSGPRYSGRGTEVSMDFRYKHSRVKQYMKEGRARIETVINKPSDIGARSRLEHLPELWTRLPGSIVVC